MIRGSTPDRKLADNKLYELGSHIATMIDAWTLPVEDTEDSQLLLKQLQTRKYAISRHGDENRIGCIGV